MEIIRVYEVIEGPYLNEDYWSLDIRTESGEATEENTKTVTFDTKQLALQFKHLINKQLPTMISTRMQELAEELYSLQTMVDSGELYWQLASEDEDEDDDDVPPSNGYLN